MESVFKVKLEPCNALKSSAYSEKEKKYIDLDNGFIIVRKNDLDYLFQNFNVLYVEYIGKLFKKE